MISHCCRAPLRVVGRTTLHYECTACHEPCDEYHPAPETVCKVCGKVYKDHGPATGACPRKGPPTTFRA